MTYLGTKQHSLKSLHNQGCVILVPGAFAFQLCGSECIFIPRETLVEFWYNEGCLLAQMKSRVVMFELLSS